MYKCIVKKVVLFLIIVFLLSSTAFAAEYTKYGSVEANAAKLVGGPDGYWIYYQAPSLATSYLSPITSGVTYWNNTFHSTTFDIHYTTSANSVNYSNSKLRFVAGNYGMGNDMFRGETSFYKPNGYQIPFTYGEDYGPVSDWSYCIIRINNEQIEYDYEKYGPLYNKTEGIIGTVAHEIGHSLGLAHHNSHNVIMNSNHNIRYIQRGIYTPQAGDIAGVAEIIKENYDNSERASAVEESDNISITQPKQSLADFTASYDRIETATFLRYGHIVGKGNGVINLGGHILDDTAYYVECIFQTESGKQFVVLEYIGFGAEKSMNNVLHKSGEYALFISESQGESYIVDPELSLQHIVDGEIVWNPAAQAAIELPQNRMELSSVLNPATK